MLPPPPPHNWPQFLCFDIHFHQKVPTSESSAPPPQQRLAPPNGKYWIHHYQSSGGSRISHWGGSANLRQGCFLAETYAKTKEFGPVVGGAVAPPQSWTCQCKVLIVVWGRLNHDPRHGLCGS